MSVSRSRIVFLILTVFVAIAGFLGYNGYKAFFGGIDSDYKAQISQEMTVITGDILAELEAPAAEEAAVTEQAPSAPQPQPGPSVPEPAAPEPPAADPARIQRVVSTYEAGFAKLQAQGNSVIDGLIADAKAEYSALKESGAGKSAILNLAISYMGKATAMEKEVDAGFTVLLSGLSSELKAAGMSEEDIAVYVADLQAAYKIEKDARRNALLDKAKSYL